MQKRALILGPGQDGSYLCEILLEKGYVVHVMHRRSSVDNLRRIAHIRDRLTLHRGDMADPYSVRNTIYEVEPDEIFNTADQDDIAWAGSIPAYSFDITAASVGRLLEIVLHTNSHTRIFQPLSAAMFGLAPPPQYENTPLDPRSVFACAKAAAWHLCKHYRRDHGLFVSCGIMFNHDSPTRSEDYVLHKICKSAVRIAQGKQDKLVLGNLNQQIDIGFAHDYMEVAVAMLQLDEPDDFVIGTGEAWRIKEMVVKAFECAGVKEDFDNLVEVDRRFQRPGPQPTLIANPTKARETFGFEPPTSIANLIKMIVEHEKGAFQ